MGLLRWGDKTADGTKTTNRLIDLFKWSDEAGDGSKTANRINGLVQYGNKTDDLVKAVNRTERLTNYKTALKALGKDMAKGLDDKLADIARKAGSGMDNVMNALVPKPKFGLIGGGNLDDAGYYADKFEDFYKGAKSKIGGKGVQINGPVDEKLISKLDDVDEIAEAISDVTKGVNNTPSEIAKSWQGSGKYPGVDNYKDIIIKKDTVIYRGEPNGTEYFTTKSAIERSGMDATKIFEGLQVEKNPIHGYRGTMQGYKFNEDVAAAFGITKANPQFGQGGLPQIFVPDVQDLINKGVLVPVDSIPLIK